MFEFNANYNTGQEIVETPTNWGEVSFEKYCSLVNLDEEENWVTRLSILSGMEVEYINTLPNDVVSILLNCILFCKDDQPLVDVKDLVDEAYKNFNYSKMEFAWHAGVEQEIDKWSKHFGYSDKLPEDRKRIISMKIQMNAAVKMVDFCTRKRIDDKTVLPGYNIKNEPVTKVLGLVNFFLLKRMDSIINTVS